MKSSRRSRASIVVVLLAAASIRRPGAGGAGTAAATIGGARLGALAVRIDALAAMETVRYMDQCWRLAANPGFNASIDYIRARLLAAGFAESPDNNRPFVRVDEWGQARGWDYQLGTVSFADNGEVLLSRLRDRVSLCINSFPTAKGGIVARLVDVGDGGAPASYASADVKGAVVLGDAEAGQLWRQAVKERGAIGVISTRIAPYIRPADPRRSPRRISRTCCSGARFPTIATPGGFGWASYRAAARMRERLENGPVNVRIEIESSFYDGPNRTLVAEIPGAITPDERIVLAAHLQEPGANDNASGAGTLQAIATALVDSARGRGLDRPARTLTFLWLDEIRGSRQVDRG